MRKLIKINKDSNIIYDTNITEFNDSDFIYVPINKNYNILVKPAERVLKGQIILENNLDKVLSPVSGKVIGLKNMNVDNVMKQTLVIENDFQEKEKSKNKSLNYDIDKLDRGQMIGLLYEFYFKDIANILETKKINNLIVNGLDDEPYLLTNEYIVNKYSKEILEMADSLSRIFGITKSIITIKSNCNINIESYLSKIGTYPNISLSLVEDKYLIGKNCFLLESLGLKEENSLIVSTKALIEMYYALKYQKNTFNTFITISGNAIKRSKVIKVPEGTLFKDVIDKLIKYKDGKDKLFVLNGLMTGFECDVNNTIVTKDTLGMIIIDKEEVVEQKCCNCGLCYRICPVKVNPKKIMDVKKTSKKCLDCGLCSYICPCHINLRKYLRGEHE